MTTRWLLPIPLLVLLSACGTFSRSGGYYQDDGPGSNPPPDVASIPDAVPRDEPRSESGNNPYAVDGVTYYPLMRADGYHERGIASWYGRKFHGKRTSSGEPYDMYSMTAAHKTLPLPSYVRVRNLQNERTREQNLLDEELREGAIGLRVSGPVDHRRNVPVED